MESSALFIALRIGGWANILIGVGHWVAMVRLRQISEWVGGPLVDRPGVLALVPYALTLVTGCIFIIFGVYALSAVGDVRRLPYSTPLVVFVSWIFLLRGLGGTGMGGFIEDVDVKNFAFSSIALLVGALYALGARGLLVGAR